MSKNKVREYRSFHDFKFGSFTAYATENITIIRGILKKTNKYSIYQKVYKYE